MIGGGRVLEIVTPRFVEQVTVVGIQPAYHVVDVLSGVSRFPSQLILAIAVEVVDDFEFRLLQRLVLLLEFGPPTALPKS